MDGIEHERVGRDDAALLVRPRGPIGQSAVAELTACVERWAPAVDGGGVVIDFGEVAYVSSVGVATLLQILDQCRERGLWLRLVRLRPEHETLLAMLELDARFETAPTLEDALHGLGL
jgi:anti-anti-sigma factor